MTSPTTQQKSFPLVPILLSIGASAGLTALAVRFYRRPYETLLDAARVGMHLSGMREETIDVTGLRMHFYSAGRRGDPIVLVHGLGSSAETWAPLMWLLSKEILVYAPDMPGFGKTPIAPEGVNISTHVLYLKRFLAALGYPRVILAGNSLGGWIATRFAVKHPERVKHLYLLNSAGLRREGLNSPYAVDRDSARRSMEYIYGRTMPLPSFVLDAVVRNSQNPAYAGFIHSYDPAEELDNVLAQVKTPTTIIWGQQDGLFPVSIAHEFHAGIPDAKLVLLPNAAHMPQTQATRKVAGIIMKDAGMGDQ
ncbi:MAG TPA: alpha/beta fold hydrolase [Ktedonobacteraceae bacterium]|jgi:pimeloyl-ACP methyl ester carboxylesterase|nr:alpha/beta fold hydrolase [Ktedonobacteraceae bacterium]